MRLCWLAGMGRLSTKLHRCECLRCGVPVLHGLDGPKSALEVRLDMRAMIKDQVVEAALLVGGHYTYDLKEVGGQMEAWRRPWCEWDVELNQRVPVLGTPITGPVLVHHGCRGKR